MNDRKSSEEAVLYVVIGCDCDPDRPQYGGVRYNSRARLKWRGVCEGIPLVRRIVHAIRDDFGNPAKITWCVRSDLQMQQIYGDCEWPYAEFAELWKRLAAQGDEIAWHPHLWRWSEQHGCWYQEIEDKEWIRDCLCRGYEGLSRAIGHALITSRMGWEFHNDITMEQINDLGIKVDFSAVPGRFTPGHRDGWGSVFNCYVDWRNTPERPYVPSVSDYRREAEAQETALTVIELPMSIFRSKLLSMGAYLRRAVRAKGRDRVRQLLTVRSRSADSLKAYITIHPHIFSRLAATQISRAKESGRAFLVTAFHADEMLGRTGRMRKLYNAGYIATNLNYLRSVAHRHGVKLRFAAPLEAASSRIAAGDGLFAETIKCGEQL